MTKVGRDYAAEVVALGRAEPENPPLYNAVRRALDDWFASSSEAHACKRSWPSGFAPTYRPNHDDGDPWCDGAARYVVSRIRWASADVDDLLAEWLDWWQSKDEAPAKLPDALHVRTALHLTAAGRTDVLQGSP